MDREILLFIVKDNPSTYSIWSAMNRQRQGRGMAYINIKKRVRRLVKDGYLEEIKFDASTKNIRGRRDYKLTNMGIMKLAPYILRHLDEIPDIASYMDKTGLNKLALGETLRLEYDLMSEALIEYQKQTKALFVEPRHKLQWEQHMIKNIKKITAGPQRNRSS